MPSHPHAKKGNKMDPHGTSGCSRHTPHHCRCNDMACGGLKPDSVSCGRWRKGVLVARVFVARTIQCAPGRPCDAPEQDSPGPISRGVMQTSITHLLREYAA